MGVGLGNISSGTGALPLPPYASSSRSPTRRRRRVCVFAATARICSARVTERSRAFVMTFLRHLSSPAFLIMLIIPLHYSFLDIRAVVSTEESRKQSTTNRQRTTFIFLVPGESKSILILRSITPHSYCRCPASPFIWLF